MRTTGRAWVAVVGVVLGAAIVAGCTSGSDGNSTPSATATQTVSTTSTAPGTASSAPVSSSAAATSSGTGTGNAAGPGLCTPTVMTFRLGQGGAAAGTSYLPIIATNASKQPCVTTGYPGVAALDAADRQIAQAQRLNGGTGGTTIVVQPGQEVSALLGSASMATGEPVCPTAPAILFTMPDNTDSTRIVAGIPACADGVSIGPLVRGESGR